MSERLSRIKYTCPIFDELKNEVDEIESYIDDEYEYSCAIKQCLSAIIDYADEIRNAAGDLRDTASDIASSKNDEIDDLEKEKEEVNDEIEQLKEEIEDLVYRLKEEI